MPTILRYKGYRLFFYSNEGDPREPLHVHVRKGKSVAKFWLEPSIGVAESYGMTPSELSKLTKVVKDNAESIKRTWDEYFD
jgi:hypothetical protein